MNLVFERRIANPDFIFEKVVRLRIFKELVVNRGVAVAVLQKKLRLSLAVEGGDRFKIRVQKERARLCLHSPLGRLGKPFIKLVQPLPINRRGVDAIFAYGFNVERARLVIYLIFERRLLKPDNFPKKFFNLRIG